MPNLFTVEELVIDDSFYCYCLNTTDDENIHTRWQRYAADNPAEKQHIEEARLIVLGLHSMLQQRKSVPKPGFTSQSPISQTLLAINSLTMGCTLYASRIAFVIIGFCITSLLSVFSIPVLKSATQPGSIQQTPPEHKYNINAIHPAFADPPGLGLRQVPATGGCCTNIYLSSARDITGALHNISFYYKQSLKVIPHYPDGPEIAQPEQQAGRVFHVCY